MGKGANAPKALEPTMSDAIHPTARSRAARAIVVDVLASALWTILRAESAIGTPVPPTMPARPPRLAPAVSQPAGISGS